MNKTVVVGMSGGVDSSVSALILKKAGFNVIGVFMVNWDKFVNNEFNNINDNQIGCESKQDFIYAQKVCEKLDIPLHKIDFVSKY